MVEELLKFFVGFFVVVEPVSLIPMFFMALTQGSKYFLQEACRC